MATLAKGWIPMETLDAHRQVLEILSGPMARRFKLIFLRMLPDSLELRGFLDGVWESIGLLSVASGKEAIHLLHNAATCTNFPNGAWGLGVTIFVPVASRIPFTILIECHFNHTDNGEQLILVPHYTNAPDFASGSLSWWIAGKPTRPSRPPRPTAHACW